MALFLDSGGSVLSGSLYFCVFGDTFFRVDRYRIKEFAIDSLNSYFENIKKDKIKQIEKKRVENLEWGVVYEINRGDKS